MEFGIHCRIKPMKEIWHNLDGPQKNKELWNSVVKFEFSRPKSSSDKQSLKSAFATSA